MAFEKTELATEHVVKNCMDLLYSLYSTDTPIIPLKDMAKLIPIENSQKKSTNGAILFDI